MDEATAEVRRGDALVAVPPKPFRLLAHLIAHRDRALTKSELLEALWPGEFVTDSSLSFCIATIRRALGESSADRSCIRAVRGTGYRFVAEATADRSASTTMASSLASVAAQPDASYAWPFVGRDHELREFDAMLDEFLAGRGALLLLGGEPGIGKSRTMHEFAARAVARGATALLGRAVESELGLPFWLWIEVIRDYARTHEPQVVREVMGPGISDIAHIAPTLRQKLGEIPDPPRLDPDQARLRLFDSIATFLAQAARRRPILICLDDLQWADASSLLFLQYLAQDIAANPVLLLGTYRDTEVGDGEPFGRARNALARANPRYRDLSLSGLTRQDVARLVPSGDGLAVGGDDDWIAEVTTRTGGNPLFLEQLYGPNGEGRVAAAKVPDTIRAVVHGRLRALSDVTRRTLSVASVFGKEFPFADLARLAEPELSEGALLDALDEGTAAHLLEEVATSPGTYDFRHALIRDAVHAELGGSRRARLHERLSAILEQVPHMAPADLAYHLLHCDTEQARKKALAALLAAAARATAQYAYDEAARHYTDALALADRVAPGDLRQRCEILLALAETTYLGGHVVASRETFQAAAEIARRIASPTLFAQAALGTIGARPTAEDLPIDLLEEALTLLPASEQAMRAQLMARIAMQLGRVCGPFERRQSLARDAIALARPLDDSRVMATVLQDVISAIWHPDTSHERAELIEELAFHAQVAGMPGWEMGARMFRIVSLMERGDLKSMRVEIEDFRRDAEILRQPAHRWNALVLSVAEALVSGRLDEAKSLTYRAREIGVRMGEAANATVVMIVQLHLHGRYTGRAAELQAERERYPEAQHPALQLQWALPLLLLATGQEDLARQVFDGLRPTLAELPTRDVLRGRFTSSAMAATACFYLDDRDAAPILYDQLHPYADRWVVASLGLGLCNCIASSLGGLAAVMGDWDAAIRHFEDAISVTREQGAVGELAIAQLDYGVALQRRGGRANQRRADELFDAAGALAERYGIELVTQRVARIRATTSKK